jgi:hypothetical protein
LIDLKILRGTAIALEALELPAKMGLPPRLGCDPGAHLPRRIMPNMLIMTAFEFSHPVSFLIQVVAGNGA